MTLNSDAGLRVAVLGPVLVEGRDGALREPSGVRGKSLIVTLALAHGSALSSGALIDDLWGEEPPRQGKAALQTLVSRVRAECADGLLVSAYGGYALAAEAKETDLGQATLHRDEASASASAGDHASALRHARAALALWRGEPGIGLSASVAAELNTEADSLHAQLRRMRAESLVELGEAAQAITELTELVTVEPLDEELHLLLMRALVAANRRNDALGVFARFRAALRDALGSSPTQRIVSFHAELLRDDARAAPSSDRRVRIGLREAPNRLIGREHDLDELERLISTSRLTTILGPGGLGKTRVAQELAHRSSAPGVVFIELASVRSGDDIALVLGSTLGIREASSATLREPGARLDLRERILTTLGERSTLLILDNCEHIVDEAAAWAADILSSTTMVRILATSRAPLTISGESVYPLDSLAADDEPSGQGAAVMLFTERALAARPGVTLPPETVARLCARLDGLPLAIELAAARVRSMTVDEIERRLGNRFALLTSGERTAPERHRTLMAVIDWSWNLLHGDERALLRRLSRFPDGFSADAAQIVGTLQGEADVTDSLDGLVSQSLASVSEIPSTGQLRYRMLETVREFGELALAEAGEQDGVRAAIFAWATDFATTLAPELRGRDQVAAFQRVGSEQDNLVSVLREAIASSTAPVVLTVFATLGDYWSMRGAHSDVAGFGAAVVRATRKYVPDRTTRDAAIASYALCASAEIAGDRRTALLSLGRLRALRRQGPPSDPRIDMLSRLLLEASNLRRLEKLLEEYRVSSDPTLAAMASLINGQFAENAGAPAKAMAEARRAYELAESTRNIWMLGTAASSIANLYSQAGDARGALDWASRSQNALKKLQASGDLQQLTWLIAVNEVAIGELANARAIFTSFTSAEAGSIGPDSDDLRSIGLAGLAEIALKEGNGEEALTLYRRASETFGPTRGRMESWFAIVTSGAISAHSEVGGADRAWPEWAARRLRTRLLVTQRMMTDFVDLPIAGTAILGVSVWLTSPELSQPTPEAVETGLQLLAIAEVLGSRQEFPSLNLARRTDAAVSTHGATAVDAARASVASLTPSEAFARACTLLRAVA